MKSTAVGSGISPTLGNGLAYFGLWWLAQQHGITFQDPELALVFAGGLVSSVILELKGIFRGLGNFINRFLPEKKDPK